MGCPAGTGQNGNGRCGHGYLDPCQYIRCAGPGASARQRDRVALRTLGFLH